MKDANGQSLAYVYGRERRADANTAHVLTMDEARRIASNSANANCDRPHKLANIHIAIDQEVDSKALSSTSP